MASRLRLGKRRLPVVPGARGEEGFEESDYVWGSGMSAKAADESGAPGAGENSE